MALRNLSYGLITRLKLCIKLWKVCTSSTPSAYLERTPPADYAVITEEKKDKILEWLASVPYKKHHNTARKGRLEDSGLWFLAKGDYKNWQGSSSSTLLWLHGIRRSSHPISTQDISLIMICPSRCGEDKVDVSIFLLLAYLMGLLLMTAIE